MSVNEEAIFAFMGIKKRFCLVGLNHADHQMIEKGRAEPAGTRTVNTRTAILMKDWIRR